MTAIENYKLWLESPALNAEEHEELLAIKGDPKEIENRFFAPLEFGTAGLRGVMATGLHNMNRHIIAHTTQAFANLIMSEGREAMSRGVAVCFDCRNNSEAFAKQAACVLAGNGIHVRIFESLRPTPELSFAIREYNCIAGINITASHNPKQYNGYKVYWQDGAQLPPKHADIVSSERDKLPMFRGVNTVDFDSAKNTGLITVMGAETDKSFIDMVMCQSVTRGAVEAVAHDFKIVYTPFHGTGYELVPRALRKLGVRKLICVPEQMEPDGDFPTVKSPNPEDKEGFALAVKLAGDTGAELIIGTDPDADRVGVMTRQPDGEYVSLTGNQTGVLLLDYIIKARRETGSLPPNPAVIKTIVTTEMAREVAQRNGVACFDTFTGFKFMAEKIKDFEDNMSYHYILAYEESYGYLTGDHARDKDAVTASMLIAEMAAWHKKNGKTLYDAMEELYTEYGCYKEQTLNLVMPGVDGLEKMDSLMRRLRSAPPHNIAGTRVIAMRDYQSGERHDLSDASISKLEQQGSNVLYYELADGTNFIVRPSGTEPKIKIYILTRGENAEDSAEKIKVYSQYAQDLKN